MTIQARSVWLIAGALATVLTMLFAGKLFAGGILPDQSDDAEQTYRQAVSRVEVDSNAGDVTLAPGPAGEVRVKQHSTWSGDSEPEIRKTWKGSTLQLRVRCPEGRGSGECSVDFDLQVPADVATDVRTEAGILTLTDLTGATRLATSAGDVIVSGARGDVTARTERGDVTGTDLRSPSVDVEVQSGDTELTFATAPKSVKSVTSAGDVQLVVPKGSYAVKAGSQSGEATVAFESVPGAAARIDATVQAGKVDVRFGQ